MYVMYAVGIIAVILLGYWLMIRKPEVPPECAIDADCPEGYVCVGGICVPGEPPPGKATLLVTVVNGAGNPISSALFTLDGLEGHSGVGGKCSFADLDPGPYAGSCTKSNYKITKVTLNGNSILFTSDGKF